MPRRSLAQRQINDLTKYLKNLEKKLSPDNFKGYMKELQEVAGFMARPYVRGGTPPSLGVGVAHWVFNAEGEDEEHLREKALDVARTASEFLYSGRGIEVQLDDLSDNPLLRKRAEEIWARETEYGVGICLRFSCQGASYEETGKMAIDIRCRLNEREAGPILTYYEDIDEILVQVGKKIVTI